MTSSGGGMSGSCRLLCDSHRHSTYDQPATSTLPVQAQLGLSSMFIDPDPLCPSHGHLCRTHERPRYGHGRHRPSTHSLLLDHWDNADPTKAEAPPCPGCDRPFHAADVCHCDCTRPDVAADVDRPPTLSSSLALDAGSSLRLPTPPPPPQTDDLKLQKTRRKSAGTLNTSTRKQSATTTAATSGDVVNSSTTTTGRGRSCEVQPLLQVSAAAASCDDDDDDVVVDDVGQPLTSPLKVISSALCRNVEQRIDHHQGGSGDGGDATRTVT